MQVFVVATPIGNLKDITLRALETLRDAQVVICEDTRVTRKLLSSHQITDKPVIRVRENSNWINRFVTLNENKKVAFVVDSGTPAISDPGSRFIKLLLENAPVAITPIPGPSAALAVVSVSGLATKGFAFLGFLGKSPKRISKELDKVFALKMAAVFYESPHRILSTLNVLAERYPQSQLVLAREMTKLYEEILRGKPAMLLAMLGKREEILGEIAVVIENQNN